MEIIYTILTVALLIGSTWAIMDLITHKLSPDMSDEEFTNYINEYYECMEYEWLYNKTNITNREKNYYGSIFKTLPSFIRVYAKYSTLKGSKGSLLIPNRFNKVIEEKLKTLG